MHHVDVVELDGLVAESSIRCDRHGEVGVVRGFRPSFHVEDLGSGWISPGCVLEPVDLGTLTTDGSWTAVPEGLLGEGEGAAVSGFLGELGTVIEFLTHSWSGSIQVADADETVTVDLRSETFGTHRVRLGPPVDGCQRWRARVDPRPDDPDRNQMVVGRVWALKSVRQMTVAPFVPKNAGNPYPPRFEELLRDLPPDAVVLDVGGGDRRHDDPRVLNFEYLKFDLPDFFGSGLELPVRTDSVDLVLSQAVLEHVPDPQRAVDEIRRILKPGGTVYCEIAFMQPLHAVPFHFFNVTPHGLQLLFESFDIVRAGTSGGLQDTMRWIFRLVDAERVLGAVEAQGILESLGSLDLAMSQKTLDHVASFVHVEATKPHG